jgi:hypothetical protein
MRAFSFVVACTFFLFAHVSSEDTTGMRRILYVDAEVLCAEALGRRGAPFRAALRASLDAKLPFDGLTHIVLANAVRVDNQGALYFLQRSSLRCKNLIPDVAGLLAEATVPQKLIVSLRGDPDDVAFDELAEDDLRRQRFVAQLARRLVEWGATGFEIEWRAGDPGGGTSSKTPFDVPEQLHLAALGRDLGAALHAGGNGRRNTLSVAVEPGRLEFSDAATVRDHIDWLTIRAHSNEGILQAQLEKEGLLEWTAKGVPRHQLVLQVATEEPYQQSSLARRLHAHRLTRNLAHLKHEGYGGIAFIGFDGTVVAQHSNASLNQGDQVPLKIHNFSSGEKIVTTKRLPQMAPSLFQRGVHLSRGVDDGLGQSREEI